MTPLLLLLLQATLPQHATVGDTIWVSRALGDVGRAVVRPQPWAIEPLGTQLGPADVHQGSGGVTVRYSLVIWYPGERQLTMPGPVVVLADGTSDTLPPSVHRVSVLSVLPAGQPRSRLDPRPARVPLRLSAVSPLPVIVLVGIAGIAIAVVAIRWRRKGKLPERPVVPPAKPDLEMLRRWVEAGEYRVALNEWGWRLASQMKQSADLEEIGALQRLLEAIATSAFSRQPEEHLADLATRAVRMGRV